MTSVRKEYLFVYGTLRRDVKHEMWNFLSQNAKYFGSACYHGKLYDLGEYPGVVPSNKATDVVHGEVYVLNKSAKVLKALDEYEECGQNDFKPAEFRRETVTVFMADWKEITAWIYLYNHPIKHKKKISSGDYLAQSIR